MPGGQHENPVTKLFLKRKPILSMKNNEKQYFTLLVALAASSVY